MKTYFKNYILLLLLIIIGTQNTYAWGFWAHKRINRLAVFTLPPEMMPLFKDNIEFLTEHAVDPDKRRYAINDEAPRHYIDLDHYCTFPCKDFPKKWNDAVNKYTEDKYCSDYICLKYIVQCTYSTVHTFVVLYKRSSRTGRERCDLL